MRCLAVELGRRHRVRQVRDDDVGELAGRRTDADAQEVGRADAVGARIEHGVRERLRGPALAEALAQHERCGEEHRRRVGDALTGDVLGRPVRGSEDARPGSRETARCRDPRRRAVREEAEERFRVRRRRHDDVETLGLEGEVVDGRLHGELLGPDAVVSRRLPRERGVPGVVTADRGDACATRARDVERARERPLERGVGQRAQERDRAALAEHDAIHPSTQVELGLDVGERRIGSDRDEHRLRAERRTPCRGCQRLPRLHA